MWLSSSSRRGDAGAGAGDQRDHPRHLERKYPQHFALLCWARGRGQAGLGQVAARRSVSARRPWPWRSAAAVETTEQHSVVQHQDSLDWCQPARAIASYRSRTSLLDTGPRPVLNEYGNYVNAKCQKSLCAKERKMTPCLSQVPC